MGSLTAANWVSFDFNVSYSSCRGYSLINTFKLKKKSQNALDMAVLCVSTIMYTVMVADEIALPCNGNVGGSRDYKQT